jgi:drug/metabolite transporter (DMT)-like permease
MMHTFLIIMVTAVWGSTFVIIKDTVASVDPSFIVFSRCFLAALPLFIVQMIRNRRGLFAYAAITKGGVLGLLLAIIYLSQTIGLQYTSSGHSAFITGSAVVLVPIILRLLFRERVSLSAGIAIAIALGGLFLLTYDFETPMNRGDLVTLITGASGALHIVLSGRFVKTATDTAGMIAWQFVGAGLVSLLSFFASGASDVTLTATSAGAILYLGVIGTLFCYFVTVWVQQYVPSLLVALTFSLEPIFAAFFGFWILQETLSGREFAGAFLILGGVILFHLRRNGTVPPYRLSSGPIKEEGH